MRKSGKKIVTIMVMAAMVLGLTACGGQSTETSADTGVVQEATTETTASTETAESTTTVEEKEVPLAQEPTVITIQGLNANKEKIDIELPYNPQRIAVLDMAALDILDTLGLGDRVVGSASTTLEYLQAYVDQDDIALLGTIKEADLEAVMACEPDVIFIGGRLSASYDALSEIAPVVYLATDLELGVVESVRQNAAAIASVFGLEDELNEKMTGFDERIAALQEFAQGKNAIVGMCTSGSFNVLGNTGRCSIIGVEIGFENLHGEEEEASTSTHGDEASFELLVDKNPDYIFVMDRDAAIGSNGAQLAQEIMENDLVKSTDAYKSGNIVYLEHPAVWYTAEGGVTALDLMLSDLEKVLLQ